MCFFHWSGFARATDDPKKISRGFQDQSHISTTVNGSWSHKFWKRLSNNDSNFTAEQWTRLTTTRQHTFNLFKVIAQADCNLSFKERDRNTARMVECNLSFKFPAILRQHAVEWTGKTANKHLTSQQRIRKKAKRFPIGEVGSHSSFLAFTTSGMPAQFMILIWFKHKRCV